VEMVPPEIEVQPETRCPKCGSAERSDYRNKSVQAVNGRSDHPTCRQIVRRWTTCLGCGQVRIDLELLDAAGRRI